jgi:phosphoribosylformylglycinamidine cyclo-ligase
MDVVNYDVLDRVKLRCIEASKKTLNFSKFGKVDGLGGSANIFSLNLASFKDSLSFSLITEGLGTADDARPQDLNSEELREFWYNIAFKVLSSLTNDAASSGLQSIAVGLYLPSSTPETVFTEEFLSGFLDGFVEGCKRIGCVYLSGETPQLKTKIVPGFLDLAGAVFAIAPHRAITGAELASGNEIVFLESSGPHENGFTTLRAFAEKVGYRTKLPSGIELWKAMNAPSVLYTPIIQDVLEQGVEVTALEHITGHGWQKIMRSKKSLRYVIENPLPVKEVFLFFESKQGVSRQDLVSVFNCGVGFTVFCKSGADKVVEIAAKHGVKAAIVGHLEDSSTREVLVPDWGVRLSGDNFILAKT